MIKRIFSRFGRCQPAALALFVLVALAATTSATIGRADEPALPEGVELYRIPDSLADMLPTETAMLGVITAVPPEGMYFYANNPGASMAMPLMVGVVYGDPPTRADILYPAGKSKDIDDLEEGKAMTHDGPTPVFALLPTDAAGKDMKATTRYLACSPTRCMPINKRVAFTAPDDPADLAPLPDDLQRSLTDILRVDQAPADPTDTMSN